MLMFKMHVYFDNVGGSDSINSLFASSFPLFSVYFSGESVLGSSINLLWSLFSFSNDEDDDDYYEEEEE